MSFIWQVHDEFKVVLAPKENIETELRLRAQALWCLDTFFQIMTESYSAPLIRPTLASLLPMPP